MQAADAAVGRLVRREKVISGIMIGAVGDNFGA